MSSPKIYIEAEVTPLVQDLSTHVIISKNSPVIEKQTPFMYPFLFTSIN